MNEITFKELAREWMQHQKRYVKESTYATYLAHMGNHLIPLLGDMECTRITIDVLQNGVLQWLDSGRKDGNGCLSEKTVRDMVVILKSCMKYASKKGYITSGDVDIIFPSPKNKNSDVQIFGINEQKKLAKSILNNLTPKTNGILISLYTGIRIGELCALKWSDVDFINRTIAISKTLQRIYVREEYGNGYTKVTITSPKTANSIREIPISAKLMNTLKRLRPVNPNTYVLTNTEKYIEPRTYRNFYNHFIHNLNISKLKFHCLRHTFATMCIESGADYKTVSELLGHANVNITMNLYVHPSIEQKRKCIELLDKLL